MPVRIVTDSSACLPDSIIEDLDITVIDLHMMNRGDDRSTSGLSSLELVACYARQLERGGDEGVLALHLSKELSSTWSNAVAAAAVFDDDMVRVIDTNCIGMGLGAAAMAAATMAQNGATLEDCYKAAVSTLERSRKSGRLSATTSLMSTALAMRPIMHLKDGRLDVAAKTRTPSKALAKIVELVGAYADTTPLFIAIQQHEARETAKHLQLQLEEALPDGTTFMAVDMDPVLAVHSGPGAIAVSAVQADESELSTDEDE